jgi:transcriptional regulator with XRE-family HTH domain
VIDGATLVRARTLAGLSQRKLAKLAGVNALTIKRIEDGGDASELPLGVLGRIAAALDMHPGDLLVDTRQPVDPPDCAIELDDQPLDHHSARLLRRIHRGQDIRRTMSRTERELILPNLVRRGLVYVSSTGLHLTPATTTALTLP